MGRGWTSCCPHPTHPVSAPASPLVIRNDVGCTQTSVLKNKASSLKLYGPHGTLAGEGSRMEMEESETWGRAARTLVKPDDQLELNEAVRQA